MRRRRTGASASRRGFRRRRRYALQIAAFAMVAVVGCRPAGRSHASSDALDGRDMYLRVCASCHGLAAHGDGTVARALTVPVPDLTTLSARHGGTFPREYVVQVVTGDRELDPHGSRAMPVWGQRFGAGPATAAVALHAGRRLEALVAYLASIQTTD